MPPSFCPRACKRVLPTGQGGRTALQVLRGDTRPGRRVHAVGDALLQHHAVRAAQRRLGRARGQADTAGQEEGPGAAQPALRQGVPAVGCHSEEGRRSGWCLYFVCDYSFFSLRLAALPTEYRLELFVPWCFEGA